MIKTPAPMDSIGTILQQVMEQVVANGVNSISMPDEYVAVAHFLCYPDEYELPTKAPAIPGVPAWCEQIKGKKVSVDVSTCDEDHGNRIFGTVDGVMLQKFGAGEDVILVIEDSRNFTS